MNLVGTKSWVKSPQSIKVLTSISAEKPGMCPTVVLLGVCSQRSSGVRRRTEYEFEIVKGDDGEVDDVVRAQNQLEEAWGDATAQAGDWRCRASVVGERAYRKSSLEALSAIASPSLSIG